MAATRNESFKDLTIQHYVPHFNVIPGHVASDSGHGAKPAARLHANMLTP